MNILVVGSGGREHAIIKKLKENKTIKKIYSIPGNGGISLEAETVNIPVMEFEKIIKFAKNNNIEFVFVAPDDPLGAGMVDEFEKAGIRAFGPNKKAAQIEASKVFSKNLMEKYNIPTADYKVFDESKKAIEYIENNKIMPVVIKADGLAFGKGVIICNTYKEAELAINSIMEDKMFGASGNKIVVEEFLTGPEVSVLAFTDGKTLKPMVSSMDHKKALDGDKGLNTGGMGAISPSPYYSEDLEKTCMDKIFIPTMNAMNKEGCSFRGCLYFGLMLTENGPKVIEYNARFGDPEAQVVLPRLKSDLFDICNAIIDENLNKMNIEWSNKATACVMMASGGYPEEFKRDILISGLNSKGQLEDDTELTVYHSGTELKDNKFYTNGGRVLGVTAIEDNLDRAIEKSYKGISKIKFDGAHYRTDIGKTKH